MSQGFSNLSRLFCALFLVTIAALPLSAQNVVEPKRVVVSQNTDFFGSDLQPIFDTTYEACERACLSTTDCRAFTFNYSASACFPKTEVAEMRPFDGAVSARVMDTEPRVLALQNQRLSTLDFLPSYYLTEAHDQAVSLGSRYPTNQWTEADLIEASRGAESAGNTMDALRFMAASVALTDVADGWADMARLALLVKSDDYNQKRDLWRIAASASINAYMRGANQNIQATALATLAQALELRSNGREMIPALRLSQALAPRRDTEDAIARAVSLYGFRVLSHDVDNDAAAPRICMSFSENLVQSGVDYSDYVQIAESGLVVDVNGTQLCIDGVSHGQRYQLTMRSGLPAESGEKLIRSSELNVYVRDRSPLARFVGRSYILPRGEIAAIPIVTVNLEEVDLRIHKVSERNLLRASQTNLLGRSLSVYDEQDLASSIGHEVWRGSAIVGMELNTEVTTALPIGEAISEFEPGVYALRARVPGDDPYDASAATQWFIVSDLGLATMSGSDGLHIFVRSLNTAQAVRGSTIQLIARDNTILAEVTSDGAGYARIAPGLLKGTGGASPAMITVTDSSNDFAFLDLTEAEFDLSDRGVAGRTAPPPIDVFLKTERGAYRVGETVYATALARNNRALAVENLPLTAILIRPDGVEATRTVVDDSGSGGHVFDFPLALTAQRGTWRMDVMADPDGQVLATAKFLVEDFVPEKIDFELSLPDSRLRLDQPPVLTISASYLFGAVGAGFVIEGETQIQAADRLDAYPGFRFGQYDAPLPPVIRSIPGNNTTDAAGIANIALELPDVGRPIQPMTLTAFVRLREGSGRPVERIISRPIGGDIPVIGIKPLFDDVVDEGGLARFEAIAVGPDLDRTTISKVRWTMNRVQTRYQWYQIYGNWNYEPITTRERVATGEVSLRDGFPATVDAPVEWGAYELKLESLEGPYTAASVDFYAGWYASASAANTPDVLEIGLDKADYRIGDTAELRIVPRYAGKAVITVMSNHLIDMKTVDVSAGENLIDLDVTQDWGTGAYVTATVIRPMDVASAHNPARAIGLNWASVNPGDRRLDAVFVSPSEAKPRETLEARLKIDGVAAGDTAFATIAAVDVGVLNLTGYKAPDPDQHYFGQQKLGMDLRDVYGRLIDGMQGAPGQIRSGGDANIVERLNGAPPTEQVLAFFSGPLEVDANGEVSTTFDMPEFNGTVRLMAIVWSDRGVGQAAQDVLVRDPVVVTAALPRFLAPYDESRILIELAHATGPAGSVEIEVSASDGLFADTSRLPSTVALPAQGRATFSVPITAPAEGIPEISIVITTPGGEVLTKTLAIAVKANDPEIARQHRVELADGETLTLDGNAFAGLVPGTGHASLAVGPIARFDAPGLLEALDRYPYGCTEQITSRALPLLYFEQVATSMGLSERRNVRARVDQAIAEVLSNQSSNGAFGLWRPGSGDLWLDAYVSDFLSRARSKGFDVPDLAFRIAMDNLRNRINYAGNFEYGGEGIAYALMVLAREGAASIGDLRYYADAKSESFATPLAMAQLGAALAYYGDQRRADSMFSLAARVLDASVDEPPSPTWRVDYGTNARDAAAVLTLASEAGSEVVDQAALARRVIQSRAGGRVGSTQENMWALMAANALIEDTPPGAFTVNGQSVDGPVVQVLDAQAGSDRSIAVTNRSGASTTTVLTTYGIPSDPEPAGGNGYSIDRFYFTTDGAQVTPDQVALNTRLVVVLKVTPHSYSEARLMINDPLPAGFEIDNPNLLSVGQITPLDWLLLNGQPEHKEFRSDRFLAAIDWSSEAVLQLAYVVRAISPGKFHHPAASVEDMYRPQFRARSAAGVVHISAN